MSFPPRPKRALSERPEPAFNGNAGPDASGRVPANRHAETAMPLRFPGERRRAEASEIPTLSAGERLVVSSVIAGGDRAPRRGFLRSVVLAALCLLAAVGAVTIYHSLAGAFPH
jgi:hypothetical protein